MLLGQDRQTHRQMRFRHPGESKNTTFSLRRTKSNSWSEFVERVDLLPANRWLEVHLTLAPRRGFSPLWKAASNTVPALRSVPGSRLHDLRTARSSKAGWTFSPLKGATISKLANRFDVTRKRGALRHRVRAVGLRRLSERSVPSRCLWISGLGKPSCARYLRRPGSERVPHSTKRIQLACVCTRSRPRRARAKCLLVPLS